MTKPAEKLFLAATRLSAALCFLVGANALQAAPATLEFSRTPFSLPADTRNLTAVDFDGDGLSDLLAQRDDELRLYIQSAEGFDFDTGFISLPRSSASLGWDLRPQSSSEPHAAKELLTLEPAGAGRSAAISSVRAYRLQRGEGAALSWSEPLTLLSELRAPIGKGITRLAFARDINADGRYDLVLPNADRLAIYLANANGYADPLVVQTETRLSTVLFSPELDREIGQAISIPGLTLRDVNSDGAADLITDTEDSLSVFLANTSASPASTGFFPSTPSVIVDRRAIRERLGEFDIENLDFSNLTGVLALSHEESLEDIDGDGFEDLLLREGGKVTVFAGTATGIDQDAPKQVLRSGGNVLSTFLYDEDDDGQKDLWLWRVEPISVGDIFLWLALSGSISVEAFIYRNQGESFARRPARKISVALKFPSVIRLASTLSDIAENARKAEDTVSLLSVEAQLDAAPQSTQLSDDLLVLANGQLNAYLGRLDAVEPSGFLSALNYSRSRDEYTIDLKAVIDAAATEPDPLAGAQPSPDYQLDVATSAAAGGLLATRINNDAKDDIFVFTAMTPDSIEGILLLSK